MPSLDERLGKLEYKTQTKSQFVDALLHGIISPDVLTAPRGARYKKTTLIDRYLEEFFEGADLKEDEELSQPFDLNKVYNSIYKEPLKRVLYGALNSEDVPSEIFRQLTGWEAVYFLAGVWNGKFNGRFNRASLEKNSLYHSVSGIILDGIELMENIVEDPEKYSDGRVCYETKPAMPHAAEIRKRIQAADQENRRIYDEVVGLIRKEKSLKKRVADEPLLAAAESAELEGLEQELPQILDSCPYDVLVKLEQRFGKEVLGDYAPSSDYLKE